jgi:two-component system alkaline phosphatase synthesis response regulator PhoP/two-component system response regulator VicR
MTCREFERLCRSHLGASRPAEEWPASARDHLAGCVACAARVRSDRATEAHLGRLRATPPLPSVDAAWSALRRALEQRVDPPLSLPAWELTLPRRILAVDDERHVVRLIELNLARAGYQVTTASEGREALRKVASEKPDLVVLDVMMPHMDGFEVLRNLKSDPITAAIPVILMSGRAQNADIFRGWQSGVDCFLDKPFNPLELLTFIRRIFESEAGKAQQRLGI